MKHHFTIETKGNKVCYYIFFDSDTKDRLIFKDLKGYFYKKDKKIKKYLTHEQTNDLDKIRSQYK